MTVILLKLLLLIFFSGGEVSLNPIRPFQTMLSMGVSPTLSLRKETKITYISGKRAEIKMNAKSIRECEMSNKTTFSVALPE